MVFLIHRDRSRCNLRMVFFWAKKFSESVVRTEMPMDVCVEVWTPDPTNVFVCWLGMMNGWMDGYTLYGPCGWVPISFLPSFLPSSSSSSSAAAAAASSPFHSSILWTLHLLHTPLSLSQHHQVSSVIPSLSLHFTVSSVRVCVRLCYLSDASGNGCSTFGLLNSFSFLIPFWMLAFVFLFIWVDPSLI